MADPQYMPQYKPCPFCGSAMDMALNLVTHASGRWQQIICAACGARGPEVMRCLPFMTAMQSWDHRAAEDSPSPQSSSAAHGEALRGLRNLKALLGTDSPEVRGWAPAVQQAAQRAINAGIRALADPPSPIQEVAPAQAESGETK